MISGTPLIGRDRELAELERRLTSARLLTVTGPGGCGKTRLALEFANQLSNVAYARRGRGRRDRPSSGWDSLTPAEVEVATLAASGRSNPQIAARLFVSRATVKMHLSSIYLKLGIGNRTELAATTATRAMATSRAGKDFPGG